MGSKRVRHAWETIPSLSKFLSHLTVNYPPASQVTWIGSLGREDPLEKGMANHCNILAWRIPWDFGELQSRWSQRVGHDWATNSSKLRERLLRWSWLPYSHSVKTEVGKQPNAKIFLLLLKQRFTQYGKIGILHKTSRKYVNKVTCH